MGRLVAWAHGWSASLLKTSLPRRWAHVNGVASRACIVSPLFSEMDSELLIAASLLHDVGYSPDIVDTGFHPLDGAMALRNTQADDRLIGLVAHHSSCRQVSSARAQRSTGCSVTARTR